MSPSFHRWVLPIVVSAIAAGCSGSGSGGSSASVPLPQPSQNVPTSQTPRYFGSVPASNPDFFVCIPGVTLKSNICVAPSKNPTAWIEVESMSFGDSESVAIGGGVVQPGQSSLSSLNVFKFADTTTPLVQKLLYTATPVAGDARLIETRTDANGTFPFSEVDLKAPIIASDQMSSGGGGVEESISFDFLPGTGAVQYAYQPLVNGLTGPVSKQNWDIATHTSDYTPNTVLPNPGLPGAAPAVRSVKANLASSSKTRVSVPNALVQSLASKAHMPVSEIAGVLNGNYTGLLTLPGLKGTSTIPGYTNATQMYSFSIGVANFGGQPSATAANFEKTNDFNSPALWGLTAASQPFAGTPAEFDLVDTTVSPSEKVAYFQLGTPYPESYAAGGSIGSGITESLSVFYAQINFCVVPYTNGIAGKPVCQSWNYLTNTPT